jgi:hypothetical protein
MACNKWFHVSCIEDEFDLEEAKERGQEHLLVEGPELWKKVISHPI